MGEEKRVIEFQVTDVDSVWLEPGIQAGVRILFCTDGEMELAVRVPPEALAKLESKLAAVRSAQAERTGIQ